MKPYERAFVAELEAALSHSPNLIQVVVGPRQVGKTTGVLQMIERQPKESTRYVSADGEILRPSSWILEQWLSLGAKNKSCLIVIDEMQKVENWSETIKKIWDEQNLNKTSVKHKLVLLGSSSLEMQRGLSESLVGRYLTHPVRHWSYEESKVFNVNLDQYLCFGGYPASYAFLKQRETWAHYVRESILHPVLMKDILSTNRVKSPALFKQCFDLACSYSTQEISYTKLLGQLQEKGNTDLVKHYLELFEGAFLLKQLFKYSNKKHLSRSSSPKILPLCPALYGITLDGELDDSERGRAFELMIGTYLASLPGELFYWREKNLEVDYVLRYGKKIWAIEVKWKEKSFRGLEEFKRRFPTAELVLVTRDDFNELPRRLGRNST